MDGAQLPKDFIRLLNLLIRSYKNINHIISLENYNGKVSTSRKDADCINLSQDLTMTFRLWIHEPCGAY